MSRQDEFIIVKNLIKENIEIGNCGLFDSRNLVGDTMITIFNGKYFTLDICYAYSYFEVFGTEYEEFEELENYYNGLLKEDNE